MGRRKKKLARKQFDAHETQKSENKKAQDELANTIKGLHWKLRKKFRASGGDFETLWHQHRTDTESLRQYAQAMHTLATQHWDAQGDTRIHWVRDTALQFFYGDGLKLALEKDARRKAFFEKSNQQGHDTSQPVEDLKQESADDTKEDSKTDISIPSTQIDLNLTSQTDGSGDKGAGDGSGAQTLHVSTTDISHPFTQKKIHLLDVGSCYNPFSQFAQFEPFAIDLCPATSSVHQCDFLQLKIGDPASIALDTSQVQTLKTATKLNPNLNSTTHPSNTPSKQSQGSSDPNLTDTPIDSTQNGVGGSTHALPIPNTSTSTSESLNANTAVTSLNPVYTTHILVAPTHKTNSSASDVTSPSIQAITTSLNSDKPKPVDSVSSNANTSPSPYHDDSATNPIHTSKSPTLKTFSPSHTPSHNSPVTALPGCSFHCVVFSLLLEYMPACQQRLMCCVKAHQLLALNGLLIIVTPDSHSQHRNAPMMKSWKEAIESLGFRRWKYEKQCHLHGMAFRKVTQKIAAKESEFSCIATKLYIPQDFKDEPDEPPPKKQKTEAKS